MEMECKDLVLKYQPHIYMDRNEPFPIRYIGCTVFETQGESKSWPGLRLDPQAEDAAAIIEYAIYYDYDIQHLYDLEHIWVAVGADGEVKDCWCSFHGMRLRAAGLSVFTVEETNPVMYAQPGKHAMLPSPDLFELHPQFHTACNKDAGGGLLIPPMLADTLTTDAVQDEMINRFICSHFVFTPLLEFQQHNISDDQYISWDDLLHRIPELITEQLRIIK